MVGRIVISDIVLRKSHRSFGGGGGSQSLDLPLRSATDGAAPLCKTQNLKVVEVIEFLSRSSTGVWTENEENCSQEKFSSNSKAQKRPI